MLRLARPDIPEAAITEAVEVLRSGNLAQGEQVARFEAALAEYLDVKHAIAVTSGTAALHLAVLALGIGPGDDVIVPAFTYPATANVVELVGARTVLVDVGLDDFCLDVSHLKKVVTPRVKAIIPVHEFGQSADMDGVMAFAERHGIDVIEDAACALGAEFRGRKVGTIGRLGCFSFHPRKAITTGEGGAVTTDHDELANMVRSLRNHGLDPESPGRMDFIRAGLNYRMTEFQAVLGRHQMTGLHELIEARQLQANLYDELLARIPGLKVPGRFPERRSVHQTYHVILPENIGRADLILWLKDRGIETNLGAHALNCLTYFKSKHRSRAEDYLNATICWRRGLALPIGAHCFDEDIRRIAAELKKNLA
ncbi:MAG: DegT/DnrJ/EryC1/StrS family aminotransferase [Desulfobacteraceae bacterium]|nr:MAG: DegT/DnrJ/EryC1/StrS family aminotransferase [Desulfobacteraceae bacterium]